jgi:tetrapyrrole methylase family protein / MazG family protein
VAPAARAPDRRGRPRIIVVGLGPAGADLVTPAADRALTAAPVVYLRTSRHPAAEIYLERGAIALDHHYEQADDFPETYDRIIGELVEAAERNGEIAYAVPGSPLILESTVARLLEDPRVDVEVIAGMSFLDLCWTALRIDPVEARVRLVDGQDFPIAAARDAGPILVTHLWNRDLLSQMKLAVDEPPSEPVVLLHHLGLADEVVEAVAWEDLDRTLVPDHLTCAYVPALSSPVGVELARLEAVIVRLRAECPWDREQTHRSLVRHLLEESYEVIEAIDELDAAGDDEVLEVAAHLEEELGDLLCQVLFHALLASEEGLFDLAGVARTLHDKLVLRHPHVFATPGSAKDATAVASRWEEIKQEEKGRTSLMEGIPAALPALLLATKVERKARGLGLGTAADPEATPAVIADALERLAAGEIDLAGPVLRAVAGIVADQGGDPEDALRREVTAFRAAFVAAEDAARADGTTLAALDPTERWQLLSTAIAAQ